jgi:hypothetical protein
MIPPNTVANKISFVSPGIGCSKNVKKENDVMENKDVITKVLPICWYPINKKGIFKKKVKRPKGKLDIKLAIIEIPTIPPSIILFGIKKISRPTAAMNEPVSNNR